MSEDKSDVVPAKMSLSLAPSGRGCKFMLDGKPLENVQRVTIDVRASELTKVVIYMFPESGEVSGDVEVERKPAEPPKE